MPRPRKNPKGAPVAFEDTLDNLDKGGSRLVMVNLKVPPEIRDDMRQRAFEIGTSMTKLLLTAYRKQYMDRVHLETKSFKTRTQSGARRKPVKK